MQPEIVTLDGIERNEWTVMDLPEEQESLDLSGENLVVPLKWWLDNSDQVAERSDIGVWFDSDDEPERLGEDCQQFSLIAVNFPKFSDGRGYSIARLLRERYGYTGELRAIGDVLLDQLHYMKRCGFNTFDLRSDKDINKAAACLEIFSDAYQAAVDEPSPLFRRRAG